MNPQFPAMNSPQRLNVATPTASSLAKVPLRPGHSLMDWIRLTRSGADLRGVGPKMLEITEEELAKHNKPNDAWMAIRGFVYNVTKYMDYHPGGGEELMRGAGMDATSLFNEIHNWVNFQSMLSACLIGKLSQKKPVNKILNPSSNFLKPPMNAPLKLKPSNAARIDQKPQLSTSSQMKISTEWLQTDENVTIACRGYRAWKQEDLVCDLDERGSRLNGCIFVDEKVVLIDVAFPYPVQKSIKVALDPVKKTLSVFLQKSQKGLDWSSLKYGEKHCTIMEGKSFQFPYLLCKLIEKTSVTRDTSIYRFQLPNTCHMSVPIGYHVYLQADIDGISITRPYTVIIPNLFEQGKSQQNSDIFLMIKAYQYGSLTPHINNLKIGDTILMSTYYEGSFKPEVFKDHKQIVLFGAGTGFTPMIRVIQYCLYQSDKNIKLYFYNKTTNDILWKNQLDDLKKQNSDRFQVEHILSEPEDGWKGKSGRISIDHIKEALVSQPTPAFSCVCGPPLYTKLAVNLLKQFSVQPENMHVFLG